MKYAPLYLRKVQDVFYVPPGIFYPPSP